MDSLVHNENKRKRKYKNFSKFPKLINKKSKYLEESFLPAEHDKMIFKEAKEEASFRQWFI